VSAGKVLDWLDPHRDTCLGQFCRDNFANVSKVQRSNNSSKDTYLIRAESGPICHKDKSYCSVDDNSFRLQNFNGEDSSLRAAPEITTRYRMFFLPKSVPHTSRPDAGLFLSTLLASLHPLHLMSTAMPPRPTGAGAGFCTICKMMSRCWYPAAPYRPYRYRGNIPAVDVAGILWARISP